jgi:hypothetical protein
MSDGIIDSTRYSAKVVRFPAPFDQGFTNAVYSVTQTTNLGGVTLPLAAELVEFRGRPGARSAAEVEPAYAFSFAVTNIEKVASPQTFVPVLTGPTLVSDERFRADTNLPLSQLLYTTAAWRPLAEVSLSRDLLEAKESARRIAGPQRHPPSLAATVLVTTAVAVPLVAILLSRRKHNQHKAPEITR